MTLRFLSLTVVSVFLLSACTEDKVPSIPEGPQSVHGTLRATEISLVRRGSHLLYQEGAEHAYVESAQVNLRSYENQMVTLSGSYEYNTDPTQLPVFVVSAVTSFEETTKEWVLPALQIQLEAPVEWERKSTAGKVHFHLPNEEQPLITLYTQARPQNEEDLPTGVSVVVDGLPAIRISNDVGGQTIHVLQDEKLLSIVYQPPLDERSETLRADWLHLLASISFDRSVSVSSAPSSTSSQQGVGTACGGPAGILCPQGQYCDITDVENDIGVCRGIMKNR